MFRLGIGRLLAETLYDAGAEVYAVSRTEANLRTLEEGRDKARMKIFAQDVGKWDEYRALLESLPAMDGLVNNAGVSEAKRVEDVDEKGLDLILNVNLKSAINASGVAARKMREAKIGGSIVNVSSNAALCGIETHCSYTASKAAMDGVTKVMAVEYGPHNIRTNSVNPTVVLTEMGKAHWGGERGEAMKKKIPMKKFVETSDVVDAIVFLLSDKSAMVNGVIMPIDGGLIISC